MLNFGDIFHETNLHLQINTYKALKCTVVSWDLTKIEKFYLIQLICSKIFWIRFSNKSLFRTVVVTNLTFIVIRTRSNDKDSVQRSDMISVQDNNSVGVTSILIIQWGSISWLNALNMKVHGMETGYCLQKGNSNSS